MKKEPKQYTIAQKLGVLCAVIFVIVLFASMGKDMSKKGHVSSSNTVSQQQIQTNNEPTNQQIEKQNPLSKTIGIYTTTITSMKYDENKSKLSVYWKIETQSRDKKDWLDTPGMTDMPEAFNLATGKEYRYGMEKILSYDLEPEPYSNEYIYLFGVEPDDKINFTVQLDKRGLLEFNFIIDVNNI